MINFKNKARNQNLLCQNRTMKYVLGIIGIIIFIYAFNSHKEKKAQRLKKEITCIEFLNANSVECLDSPFVYVNKISKKEAEKKLVNYKKDIEEFNNELNQFFLNSKVNESEYKIISWSELDYIDAIVKETRNEKMDIYDEKIVALSKLAGCLTTGTIKGEIKYYICTDTNRNNESDFRHTILIDNIENLPKLKRILNRFSELGLRSEGLFRSQSDLYDLQVYGKITKMNVLEFRMEIHGIKFFKKLVSDKEILNLLEQKIFWSTWNKVRDFQKSRSL